MIQMYQGWCIDKTIKIEAEIEIKIKGWDMQRLKALLHLIRKLQFNK